jgi:AcrR family transcriptional regulator
VEDAVLEAIVMLVRQHGLEAVTIQMVADAAGVGRQTIYRRWPRREEMLLDALVKRTAESCSVPSTCRKARKSRRSVRIFDNLNADGRFTCDLLVLIHDDPAARRRFREQIVAPWIALVVQRLTQIGVRADLDLRLFAFMLQSALVYQMQLGGVLDEALQERCCRFIRSML